MQEDYLRTLELNYAIYFGIPSPNVKLINLGPEKQKSTTGFLVLFD